MVAFKYKVKDLLESSELMRSEFHADMDALCRGLHVTQAMWDKLREKDEDGIMALAKPSEWKGPFGFFYSPLRQACLSRSYLSTEGQLTCEMMDMQNKMRMFNMYDDHFTLINAFSAVGLRKYKDIIQAHTEQLAVLVNTGAPEGIFVSSKGIQDVELGTTFKARGLSALTRVMVAAEELGSDALPEDVMEAGERRHLRDVFKGYEQEWQVHAKCSTGMYWAPTESSLLTH